MCNATNQDCPISEHCPYTKEICPQGCFNQVDLEELIAIKSEESEGE